MNFQNKVAKNTNDGRYAEHLVCRDLLRFGLNAAVSPFPQSPYDVMVDLGAGKSTSAPFSKRKESGRGKGKAYRFKTGRGQQRTWGDYRRQGIDLLAFVATDLDLVVYAATAEWELFGDEKKVLNVGHTVFAERAQGSLERALTLILGDRK